MRTISESMPWPDFFHGEDANIVANVSGSAIAAREPSFFLAASLYA